ncbi:MAG: hypothetical protein AB4050_07325 [Synechococcus sp.]
MHALKVRRRVYTAGTDATQQAASDRREMQVTTAVQILTIGLLSGLCCFTGSLLFLQVL